MKREKLIRSKGYNISKIQNELYRQLTEYLEINKMTRSAFAKHLGVSKGYISQVLNGDFDYKISKLVELSLAIGKVPLIKFELFENLESKNNNKLKIVHMKPLKLTNSSSSVFERNVEFELLDLKKAR